MVGSMKDMLEEYIGNTVRLLVDNPSQVEVSIVTSTKSIIAQMKVLKCDFGKIIGKKGRTIDSLKTISLAIKNTHYPQDARKVSLELIEEGEPLHKSNKQCTDVRGGKYEVD